ncbi:MAG: hypothetical protein IKR19_07985 [Acholeplasmatales bacterium]|nr:hypothetical protein [Acholeplasmatales bacterium]
MTNNYVTPINVLKSLGIPKEQYARMGTREVMMLVRLAYSHQNKHIDK